MHRLASVLVVSVLLACGSQNPGAPADPPPAEANPDDAPPEEVHADPNEPHSGAVDEDCAFKVEGTCYKEEQKEEACKAAGCEPDKCTVGESFPAVIGCAGG